MADNPKKETTEAPVKEKKSWLAGANAARKAARAEKAASKASAVEPSVKIKIENSPEGSNGKKTKHAITLENDAAPATEGAPEFSLAEKKRLHREIFEKCVEKKMFQEIGSWES